jgi:hypothetical protein
MLARVLEEIPKLTDAVIGSEVYGDGSYDVKRTGAADAARSTARGASSRARSTTSRARSSASSSSSRSRGGSGSSRSRRPSSANLPIAGYDDLPADEIVSRLADLSDGDRQKVLRYERSRKRRATVIRAAERSPAQT